MISYKHAVSCSCSILIACLSSKHRKRIMEASIYIMHDSFFMDWHINDVFALDSGSQRRANLGV
jgi:hypothetical protein